MSTLRSKEFTVQAPVLNSTSQSSARLRRVNPKTGGKNGHTMIYVGNDLFLHCSASDLKSFLGNTPEKTYERRFDEEVKGAIFEMPVSEVLVENESSRYLFYGTETHKKTSFTFSCSGPIRQD